MKKNMTSFFKNTSLFLMIAFFGCVMCDAANAARTAIRGTAATRRTSATTQTTPSTVATSTTDVVEEEPDKEPEIIENKASQFDSFLNEVSSDEDMSAASLAEQIRKQRAAAEARDNAEYIQSKQQTSLTGGKNVCDNGLRTCMQRDCGSDFSKCALDGDTLFGDKLNKCRRETTCNGEEFKLFTAEIKADRDMNARLSSYTSVIDCGNQYNACIQNECGTTFGKCLGKTAADRATKACEQIAKRCIEQDSGLAGRFGTVIGRLREHAEIDVKTDEMRMYKLRDLMKNQCTKLGAMFDERSFDCVYTVNFFAGENQQTPIASRKVYAGDSFVCMQEWFGVNATTYRENAYRETRAQTGASSAMLGSGVGTAVGLISSGAIGRALDTQKAKKALDAAEKASALKDQSDTLNPDYQKDGDFSEGQDTKTDPITTDKIKRSMSGANMVGQTISFTTQDKNDETIAASLEAWKNKCTTFTKLESGIKSAEIKETVSGDTITWECVAKECSIAGMEVKDGKCQYSKSTLDSGIKSGLGNMQSSMYDKSFAQINKKLQSTIKINDSISMTIGTSDEWNKTYKQQWTTAKNTFSSKCAANKIDNGKAVANLKQSTTNEVLRCDIVCNDKFKLDGGACVLKKNKGI